MIAQIIYAELENMYSCSHVINKKKVDELTGLGLEEILKRIENNPIKIDYRKWKDKTIMEVAETVNGDEYIRALINLGVNIIPVVYDENRINPGVFEEITNYVPIKVKDAPLLDEVAYEEYSNSIDEVAYRDYHFRTRKKEGEEIGS